eukprot:s1023_g26.t1
MKTMKVKVMKKNVAKSVAHTSMKSMKAGPPRKPATTMKAKPRAAPKPKEKASPRPKREAKAKAKAKQRRTSGELVNLGGGAGGDNQNDEVFPPSVPTNVKELFGLHHSFLETLFQKEHGEKEQLQALREMRDMVGRLKVFSLFSGVGGAELCTQQLYLAVKKKCEDKGLDPPTMPQSLLSCDVDPSCQEVLSNHLHPPRYIVDDMMRFLTPK